jgi:para-aminobenzoate synthetase component 1
MTDRPIITVAPGIVVRELCPAPDVESCFLRFRELPYCLLLDSALRNPELGRYSFLCADPFAIHQHQEGSSHAEKDDPFEPLRQHLSQFASPTIPELPPFQGGVAGLLSYELGREFETLPVPKFDQQVCPRLLLGSYDVVLAWDHAQNRAWLISQGWPEVAPTQRQARAQARLTTFEELLALPLEEVAAVSKAWPRQVPQPLPEAKHHIPTTSAPRVETHLQGVSSNFSRVDYEASVERVREYIRAGDVFQVNLAQCLTVLQTEPAWQTYSRLRQRNPATFGGYFDAGTWQLLSASPERFLQVRDRAVETRPIKGTRPRTAWPEANLFHGDDLLASDKDRAENIMIVDLLRNDLSRVCDPDSVHVPELCRLERYEYVQHLVSVVQGRLAAGKTVWDLFRDAWPGGSITGAPKLRAMEIITELEQLARGPYCGSLIYHGFDGAADSNLLIRTIVTSGGECCFSVGGGITLASEPALEYAETWHKATGLLQALGIN